MKTSAWVGIASSAMLLSALIMSPGVADAGPRAHSASRASTAVNYSGDYKLTYVALISQVDACVSIGPRKACGPVTINIPLYNGVATVDSLDFLIDFLDDQLAVLFPGLPPEAYPSFEAMITYMFPPLVDELNTLLLALPPTMGLTQRDGSSYFEAALAYKDVPMVLPGTIDNTSGEFHLLQNVMWGGIDTTTHTTGFASAKVPIHISESAGYETPIGVTATFSISLDGTGYTGMDIKRQ